MRVIIVQENKQIARALERLWKASGTNLSKLCKDNKLSYGTVYQKLQADTIDVDWLKMIVKKINKKAKFQSTFTLSLMLEDEVIIHQKQK